MLPRGWSARPAPRRRQEEGRQLSRRADRSGGLNWHLRALARRGKLWRPFRDELATFLARWQPMTRTLILAGPSAGWCLPSEFLTRFDRIMAVDPDPWAQLLFRRLHPEARVGAWLKGDFFGVAADLLAAEPDAAILFCNMLGQLRFAGRDAAETDQLIAGIAPLLAGRSWASFHELLSGETDNNPRCLSLAGRPHHEALLKQLGLAGEWLDHAASHVLPQTMPREIVPWRFAPGRVHLVELGIGGGPEPFTAQPS